MTNKIAIIQKPKTVTFKPTAKALDDFYKSIEEQEKPSPKPKFKCPLCGSKDYDEHTEHNGIIGPGFRSWVTGYSCNGCSVQFTDIAKFMKRAKKG